MKLKAFGDRGETARCREEFMQHQAASSSLSDVAARTARPFILVAAAVGLALILLAGSAMMPGEASNKPLNPACTTWDAAASAVVGLTGDSAQRVNEATFRLKRARRNCQEGWVNLACHDYQAVINGIEVVDGRRRIPTSTTCSTSVAAGASN
jgi:hypothetical protein